MSALARKPAGNAVTAATIEANIAAAVAATPVTHSRFSVPVLKRPDVGVYILIGLCLAIGYGTRTFQATRTIVQTKTVKLTVEQQLGKPAQTVDGARVNKALTGFRCDVYQAKAVVLCHR